MGLLKDLKKLGRLFESDEDRAYREAYDKECISQARLKAVSDAKKKYKEVKK